ncbi:hypothetical protein [Kribbella italica]|uniref:Lipoprotein LpqN n=1 Tax=Kribbella italica TaxID=1540520 RepID=A0A7W9MX60_9ACTN|nr:hypothetical protein [Kribbella italica]MBB5839042.1 hypothetical protein [Kribbella italica]
MRPRTRVITVVAAAVLAAGATTALLLARPATSAPAASAPGTPSTAATPTAPASPAGTTPGGPVPPTPGGPAATTPGGPATRRPASTAPGGPAITRPGGPPTATPVGAAPLTAQGLTYVNRVWGDPKTELGVIVPVPNTWSMAKLSTFESRFTSPNQLWTLRLNGVLAKPQPRITSVAQQLAALKSTPGFQLISRTDGAGQATSPVFAGVTFQYTTLTYSYTDPARGTRLVLQRYVTIDNATSTGFELAASGRPQDLAALQTIATKATLGYVRLP